MWRNLKQQYPPGTQVHTLCTEGPCSQDATTTGLSTSETASTPSLKVFPRLPPFEVPSLLPRRREQGINASDNPAFRARSHGSTVGRMSWRCFASLSSTASG